LIHIDLDLSSREKRKVELEKEKETLIGKSTIRKKQMILFISITDFSLPYLSKSEYERVKKRGKKEVKIGIYHKKKE
jgi:hypothetical protein